MYTVSQGCQTLVEMLAAFFLLLDLTSSDLLLTPVQRTETPRQGTVEVSITLPTCIAFRLVQPNESCAASLLAL